MDHSAMSGQAALQAVLILLASSVLAVAACRSLRVPPIIGYLATGDALGPHALGVDSEGEEINRLAEVGVVFLMLSIGLAISHNRLKTMQRMVHARCGTQVGCS